MVANNKGGASSSSAREVCRSAAGGRPFNCTGVMGLAQNVIFSWQYVIYGEMSSAGNANPNGTPFGRL